MTDIQRVRELQKTIKQATAAITKIQKRCPHNRTLHEEGPRGEYGWIARNSCADCGILFDYTTKDKEPHFKKSRKILKK